jgi:hypothetical protein
VLKEHSTLLLQSLDKVVNVRRRKTFWGMKYEFPVPCAEMPGGLKGFDSELALCCVVQEYCTVMALRGLDSGNSRGRTTWHSPLHNEPSWIYIVLYVPRRFPLKKTSIKRQSDKVINYCMAGEPETFSHCTSR